MGTLFVPAEAYVTILMVSVMALTMLMVVLVDKFKSVRYVSMVRANKDGTVKKMLVREDELFDEYGIAKSSYFEYLSQGWRDEGVGRS